MDRRYGQRRPYASRPVDDACRNGPPRQGGHGGRQSRRVRYERFQAATPTTLGPVGARTILGRNLPLYPAQSFVRSRTSARLSQAAVPENDPDWSNSLL